MSQKVHVTIDPKSGEVTYEVEGVMGGKCTDITAALVRSNDQKDSQYTSEYEVPDVLPDYVSTPEGE